jgi:prepilin-type N-terminal cleavage/methylation domain-containing protein
MSRARSAGFTLVELLVVITIIGILLAMLMPAVQAAREAGRLATCLNRLKQIGLALHSHHTNRGELPAASNQQAGSDRANVPFSWAVAIFPYMELDGLYNQLQFAGKGRDAPNAQLTQTVVPGFVCPSDSAAGRPILHNRCTLYGDPEYAMGAWYHGCWGPIPIHSCPNACPCAGASNCYCCRGRDAGMFNPDVAQGITFSDVPDGLSNTIMAGETLPAFTVHSALFGSNLALCSTNTPLNSSLSLCGSGNDGDDLHSVRPTEYCDGFKSMHPGVVNFVLGDGSVHTFSQGIDYKLFNELGSRNGREVVVIPD